MYELGSLILYGRTGVCRVEEIKSDAATGAVYYVLQPLYQSCSITIPANNPKVFTRPIISRAQALDLISRMPSLEAEPYHNRNLNQLRTYYLEHLDCRSCESLACLAKSIFLKRKQAEQQKKKFGVIDERFLKEAENLLFGEFAAALEIERSEVENYIANCLSEA